jgi:2-methylcitrate dehydratase PrpD
MNTTETMAHFLCKTSFEDLPGSVVKKAKMHFLDYIGVSLDGFRKNIHKHAIDLYPARAAESSVIGSQDKKSCVDACFLNSIMAGSSNFEDGHRFASGHPAAVVTPAALAVAELQGSTGKDFILSVVLGYEIFCRVARCINPSHLNRGFHSTSTVGAFGSASAVGKILHLDYDQVCRSLDLATAFSGAGFLDALTSQLRYFQVARASQAGLIAAFLARQNISTSRNILDGPRGFCSAVADKYDLLAVTEGLGERFEIMTAYLKMHGGCRHIAAPMDAVRKIIAENSLSPLDIERIFIKTYPVAMDYEIENPTTGTEAEFSIPFGVSISIFEPFTGPEAFTDNKLNDPAIKDMMKRISVEVDPRLAAAYPNKRGVIAQVYSKAGEYQCELEVAKGDPEFPASENDIIEKFRHLTAYCFTKDEGQRVIDSIMNMENLASLNPVISRLTSVSPE